jgi:hypothetical protein
VSKFAATRASWLQRLAGEWAWESEPAVGDKSGEKHTGTETVRLLGDHWVVFEGEAIGPDGAPATTLMSIGFDPSTGRHKGTFIASMMSHLWLYDGELDDTGNVIVLDTEGPSFFDESKMAKYKDSIEFISDDHRVLASRCLQDDGTWVEFMRAHYRRT